MCESILIPAFAPGSLRANYSSSTNEMSKFGLIFKIHFFWKTIKAKFLKYFIKRKDSILFYQKL
jgi:hypothetical protein